MCVCVLAEEEGEEGERGVVQARSQICRRRMVTVLVTGVQRSMHVYVRSPREVETWEAKRAPSQEPGREGVAEPDGNAGWA